MLPVLSTEKLVETKTCRHCAEKFPITDKDLEFYEKVSPIIGGEKQKIPTPTICPTCRSQRRLSYRNDRSLFLSTSSSSGKPIISMYHPDNKFVVYDQKDWWGGNWDGLQYGRDYDFSRGFFEQYAALQKVTPRFNVFNKDTENCEYVNYAPHCKDCYLVFGTWFSEACYYGQTVSECKNCVDNLFLEKSEYCYEHIDGTHNYHSFYCQNCNHAVDSYFCFDCENIKNCIGCWNLRNKEFYVFNKPVSKEEYKRIALTFSSYTKFQEVLTFFRAEKKKKAIHKNQQTIGSENVSGDFIFNSTNAKQCFSSYNCSHIAFSARAIELVNSYDFDGGGKSELIYENMSNDFAFHSIGCTTCENLKFSHYCDLCFECENCFGCVGLRNKQYCVFNKQYSKEDYEELVKKIVRSMIVNKEWGEFPPVKNSPFSYNETMAQDYFPLTKAEATKKWFNWSDYEAPFPKVEKIIPASKLPDDITKIPDDIVNWAIECEVTKKPFRIIKQELEFYRKHNLPIPRRHPDQRHLDRMALRNPRKLFDRKCAKCKTDMLTTYAPERPEIVYCEACYQKEVIG